MKHFLVFIFLLTASCATIAGIEEEEPIFHDFATLDERDISGQPRIDFRLEGGVYYWKTANTWHIRFARPYASPKPIPEGTFFSGNIRVKDGIIIDLKRYNVSPFNDLRRIRDNISFRFEIKEEVEGFDFIIQPVLSRYCVVTNIKINGIYAAQLIRLGEFMHRPDAVPMEICVRSFE